MTKKFNLTELLNQRSREPLEEEDAIRKEDLSGEEQQEKAEIVMVDVYDLEPSKENFYQVDDSLKRSVELVGILQPLLVKPPRDGKYRVIAGHRRRLAVLALMEEGKEARRYVPCVLKKEDVRDRLAIILANRFRDKTDWEKMREVVEAEGLAKEIRADYCLGGRTRDILAEIMGMSQAQVGRYQAIDHHLEKELMEEFQAGTIGFSAVSELCGLPKERQRAAAEQIREKGGISLPEIKELKRKAMARSENETKEREASGTEGGETERAEGIQKLKERRAEKQEPEREEAVSGESGKQELKKNSGGPESKEKKPKEQEPGEEKTKKQEPENQEGSESIQRPGIPGKKEPCGRKRPMTTKELFDEICEKLEEKGKMPELLDYRLADNSPVPLDTCEFHLKNNLGYGGNEGIYLDFQVERFPEGKREFQGLGTFKTLQKDEKAMHTMAALLADFILEMHDYVNQNLDDFEWTGVDVRPLDDSGNRLGWGYSCSSREAALKRKDGLLEKYLGVVVRENASHKETVYYRNTTETPVKNIS